jgi:rubrerythrin
VPLPNWVVVDRIPSVYHLVELKDTYHRYVVMISTEQSARILEVSLGAVTEQVWRERPELRKRVGREWTKNHYQNHRRERGGRFIKEKTGILDELMSAGGYAHLILAGHPTITARVRDELPKHLLAKLVDIVPASGKTPVSDVVEATLASFIEQEEKESHAVAAELEKQIQAGGLAVAGAGPSFLALKRGRADILVLARSYAPGQVWACTACDLMDPDRDKPTSCPACGSAELQEFDLKEELARMAEQQGCTVEVVNESETLAQLGDVGCLLRYRLPEEYT